MRCKLKCPCYQCTEFSIPKCAHHTESVYSFSYDTCEEEELDRELAGFNEPERWVEREDYA